MNKLAPILLGLVLLTSGCTTRYIYGVQGTPISTDAGRPSTIVQVAETTWYAFIPVMKDVYYECRNDGGKLDCVRTCDVKNEEGEKVKCMPIFVGG